MKKGDIVWYVDIEEVKSYRARLADNAQPGALSVVRRLGFKEDDADFVEYERLAETEEDAWELAKPRLFEEFFQCAIHMEALQRRGDMLKARLC